VSGGQKGKKRREYPQRQPRKSLPQSSSRHESGCQRRRWWLRVERCGSRKRLLHEGLSSRLDEGKKGKGSDKGGDETERKSKGEGRERCCTVTVATIHQIWSRSLTRLFVLTPSTTPFPLSLFFRTVRSCDDARPQSANLISTPSTALHSAVIFPFDECLPRVFFSRMSTLGVTATCHGSRGSRPDVACSPCFRTSPTSSQFLYRSSLPDASLKRI